MMLEFQQTRYIETFFDGITAAAMVPDIELQDTCSFPKKRIKKQAVQPALPAGKISRKVP
jgi:hypothetical protein